MSECYEVTSELPGQPALDFCLCSVEHNFGLFRGVKPHLLGDRKRRSRSENSTFRPGFFNQKKKAISWGRFLKISEHKNSFRPSVFSHDLLQRWGSFSTREYKDRQKRVTRHRGVCMTHLLTKTKREHQRDTTTHTPAHQITRAYEGIIFDSGTDNAAVNMYYSSVAVATTKGCCTILLPAARAAVHFFTYRVRTLNQQRKRAFTAHIALLQRTSRFCSVVNQP